MYDKQSFIPHCILKITSTQVVETSVSTKKSLSQDYTRMDSHINCICISRVFRKMVGLPVVEGCVCCLGICCVGWVDEREGL